MEKAKKELLQYSNLILFFLGLDVINLTRDFIGNDFDVLAKEAGAPTWLIITLPIAFFAVIAAIKVFVAIKGRKESASPSKSKAHIILAIIFALISTVTLVFGFISFFTNLSGGASVIFNNIFNVIINAIDVIVFVMFTKYAFAVQKEA